MKDTRFAMFVALVASAMWYGQATAQNLLTDPSFENPALFTTDGPPFVGSWEAFNGGAGTFSINDTLSPHSGSRDAHLNITATDNSFAGFFQDIPVEHGALYEFSGFHRSVNLSPADYVTEVRFEWRNSVTNVDFGFNQKNYPLPIAGPQYSRFVFNSYVPGAADTLRVVYDIETFDNSGTTNTGDVFVDDLLVEKIPEPSSIMLAGLGGLALLRMRRRSARRVSRRSSKV